MIFLIQYDRVTGRLVRLDSYTDGESTSASKAKLDLEISLLGENGKYEIVLLRANSEQDLKTTHRRYFETLEELGNRDGKQ